MIEHYENHKVRLIHNSLVVGHGLEEHTTVYKVSPVH
jgi:hypothetical protein